MQKLIINGGNKLYGNVQISSAKNAVLPLIAASILNNGKTYIRRCPKIYDVLVMAEIINHLGGKAYFDGQTLVCDTQNIDNYNLPCGLTREVRASLFMVGALISRFNRASVCMPGGCNIGKRPIDIHIDALSSLGVKITQGEIIEFEKCNFSSSDITLRFPSVGATENAIMASVFGKGVTIIRNAAKEPEIIDLQNYINKLGGKVKGAGDSTITVEGVDKFTSLEVEFFPCADRIEMGTFLFVGASCGGEMTFESQSLKNNFTTRKIVENNACKFYTKDDKIIAVKFYQRPNGFGKIVTQPYPGFATDLHPQLAATACIARGLTVIEENIFENRMAYSYELKKMGADISVFSNVAVIDGVKKIHGANMTAADLRGGAALVIAALSAEGQSQISGVRHIDRGYELLDKKLAIVGADIKRIDI